MRHHALQQASLEFELASEVDSHVDYYFFGGATVDASVALFRAASGAAPLFAKWVYGFWQCKEHYASQDELIAAAEGFRNRSLPLDAMRMVRVSPEVPHESAQTRRHGTPGCGLRPSCEKLPPLSPTRAPLERKIAIRKSSATFWDSDTGIGGPSISSLL